MWEDKVYMLCRGMSFFLKGRNLRVTMSFDRLGEGNGSSKGQWYKLFLQTSQVQIPGLSLLLGSVNLKQFMRLQDGK